MKTHLLLILLMALQMGLLNAQSDNLFAYIEPPLHNSLNQKSGQADNGNNIQSNTIEIEGIVYELPVAPPVDFCGGILFRYAPTSAPAKTKNMDTPANDRFERVTTNPETASNTETTNDDPSERIAPKPASEPTSNTVSDAGSAFNNEMLAAVNKQRSTGCTCGGEYMPPVPPLQWDYSLESAAKRHVEDMESNNHFSHFGTDNSLPDDRMKEAGYTKSENFGENIGMGYQDIPHAMEGWIGSSGHCKGIMSPDAIYIGAARKGKMWCQAFGKK